MRNWEMPVMEELLIEETACHECSEKHTCGTNCDYLKADYLAEKNNTEAAS